MIGFTVDKAAGICDAELFGGGENSIINKIEIDSRAVSEGDLFVAFKGSNTDGHRFISSALEKGAACCLANYVPEGCKGPVIVVPDVEAALEKLTSAFRETIDIPVIGITGSVGKTTGKEMIASVICGKFRTLKTYKNFNNTIGVPMTMSQIGPEHEAAVVEMGINHPDEMRHLAVMVRPTIAVFTVMGHAHLEFLKSPEGVFREKTSMLNYMRDDAVAVVNGDDPLLDKLVCRQRIIRYGLHSNADVRATNIVPNGNSIDCRITYLDRELHAEIPGFGNHMVYAALEAASVGFVLGLDDDQIIKGIRSFKALEGRSNLIETSYISLIDDCYNANPDSARSSLDSMCNFKGRKVFIFGDMLELGENTKSMHADIGRYANGRADLLITVGMLSYNAYEAFEGPKQSFVTTDELLLKLDGLIEKGDTVLIKASRDSALFKVRDALKELGGGNSDG